MITCMRWIIVTLAVVVTTCGAPAVAQTANKWLAICSDACGANGGCTVEPPECQKARKALERTPTDATAQFNLGVMYANGWGGPRDEVAATGSFFEAAVKGLPQARSELGVRLLRGRGAPRNYVQALAWLDLAERSQREPGVYRKWLLETLSESEIEVAAGIADGIAASGMRSR